MLPRGWLLMIHHQVKLKFDKYEIQHVCSVIIIIIIIILSCTLSSAAISKCQHIH